MFTGKLAAIMSGLSPYGSAPPRAQSSTPGLGEKMRTETSSVLEKALTKGKTDALSRFKLKAADFAKIARGAMPMGAPMHPALANMHADLHMAHAATPPPVPTQAPAARPAVSWADMHHGVAQQQAANLSTHPAALPAPTPAAQPAPLPAARAFEGHGSAATGGGTGGGTPASPSGGGGGGGGASRFMRPMGKALGYGALAGAGALAYGMHRQNQEDRDAQNLVYAPMQGAY